MRARRLKAIAAWINENLAEAGFRAVIVEGYDSKDRHIAGTRLRIPGKGKSGNKLVVFRKSKAKEPKFRTFNCDLWMRREDEHVVLSHNAAETYRSNDEVEDWLRRQLEDLGRLP